MSTHIIIATFKQETNMKEVMAVVAEERAQVVRLKQEGRLGAVHLALARGTVFLEIFASDAVEAEATARTLPMARWWNIDVYPVVLPAQDAP